jgi:hypothetical protein
LEKKDMPKAIVATIKMTVVLSIIVLVILGLLGVLNVYPTEELLEMLKTAFLVIGIFTAGSIAITAVTSDWSGGNDQDSGQ